MSGLSGDFVPAAGLSRMASDVYAELSPLTEQDATYGYPLRTLVQALCKMIEDVDELVREGTGGETSWSALFDPTRTPEEGLAWLGQLLGVPVNRGESIDTRRARVVAAAGINRGTKAAMTAAAAIHLTGTKHVLFIERTSDAYHFGVRTRSSETPDPTQTLADLISAKPAGLIMDYTTYDGVTFEDSLLADPTYADSTTAHATYALRSAP